jgi:hypothetical protein
LVEASARVEEEAEMTDATRPGIFEPAALRDYAERTKSAGKFAGIDPDHLLRLLDSHDTALRLAEAVEEMRKIDMGTGRFTEAPRTERATAGELRNKWRRVREEQGLKVDAALKSFRHAAHYIGTVSHSSRWSRRTRRLRIPAER